MDRMTLSEAQESVIIDFIKRWGIDTPELVAEMMDHYCELAIEEMSKGREFQLIVNSWKTKQTLHSFRAIEKSYGKQLKKTWKQEDRAAIKKVLLGKPVLILIALYFLFVITLNFDIPRLILAWSLSLKILISALVVVYYFSFDKKKSRIHGIKRMAFYGSYSMWMLVYLVPDLLNTYSLIHIVDRLGPFVLSAIFTLIVGIDMVCYFLYQRAKQTSVHLTDEILTEYKLPPRI